MNGLTQKERLHIAGLQGRRNALRQIISITPDGAGRERHRAALIACEASLRLLAGTVRS